MGFIGKNPIFEASKDEVDKLRVRSILLGNHNGLIYGILCHGLWLDEVVSWNIETISGIQSHIDDPRLFCKRVNIVVDVEKVDWAIHFLELLVNSDIDLLPEYGWDKSEFFSASENTNMLFVNLIFSSPCKVGPLVIECGSLWQESCDKVRFLEQISFGPH